MDGHRGAPYRTIEVTPYSPHVGAEIGEYRPHPAAAGGAARRSSAAPSRITWCCFSATRRSASTTMRGWPSISAPSASHVGVRTHSRPSEDDRVRRFHFDEYSEEVSGNVWHTDQSCAPVPPLASILYNHTLPPNGGGDTLFASMYAAYDALSDRMKSYLEGLTALHDGVRVFGEGTPRATHPVVVRHPESGRKLLYVNESFTVRIEEIPPTESRHLLAFLVEHCTQPEWTCRFRWRPHSIAMWDNRCAQHRAISDYLPNVRSGYRVQIDGVASPVAG